MIVDNFEFINQSIFSQRKNSKTIIYDVFSDGDNTLLSAHSIVPINTVNSVWSNVQRTLQIESNQVCGTGTANSAYVSILDCGFSDVEIDLDIIGFNTPALGYAGIMFRYLDTSNFWCARVKRVDLDILEYSGADPYIRATIPHGLSLPTSGTLQVILRGDRITAKYGGVQTVYVSTTRNTSSKHGIVINRPLGDSNLSLVDNFKIRRR